VEFSGLTFQVRGNGFQSPLVYFTSDMREASLSLTCEEVEPPEISVTFVRICRLRAVFGLALVAIKSALRDGDSIAQIFLNRFIHIRNIGIFRVLERLKAGSVGREQNSVPYGDWINCRESPLIRFRLQRELSKLTEPPLVSVICDMRGIDGRFADDTFASLNRQMYPKWEVLFLSDRQYTADNLSEVTQGVEVILNDTNETPSAWEDKINGPWLLPLKAGSELQPTALAQLVNFIQNNDNISLLYGDNDQLCQGERTDPSFKPGWNRELFYVQNYIGSCLFIRKGFLEKGQPLRTLDQIVDVEQHLLNAIDQGTEDAIARIPVILTSEAESSFDATDNAGRALRMQEHLQKRGLEVSSTALPNNKYRLHYSLPAVSPLVNLVIPTRDSLPVVKRCVDSILSLTTYQNYKITVVDNGSIQQDTLDWLEKMRSEPGIRVLRYDQEFNFSAINNYAVTSTDSDLVCLVNNDIEVITPTWLEEMLAYAVQDDVGCVGAKLLYSNNKVQHAGVLCGVGYVAAHAHRNFDRDAAGYWGRLQLPQEYSAVTAACMMVRRKTYQDLGGLDEDNLPVAYNDVDFCLRLRKAGYRNIYTPHAELYHHESLSRGSDFDSRAKRKRYKSEREYMWQTWGDYLDNDPYYNPNLSRTREDFSLRV
jgi:GT2 family glycosyltransferase